ncbi:MAG TPA: (d)CMP kinase [Chloroflexi bacterium]|nr:(d)CMP kinase [Chloroflexota bacterium]
MSKPSLIAIDGPAAAGKTTLAHQVAERLGYLYFDTGVMYRAVTLAALERGIDISDEAAISALAEQVEIDVRPPTVDDGRTSTVYLDGEDVTNRLFSAAVDASVSAVSAYPGVRAAMTRQQRRIGERGQVVMVGRDIGTVVFPDADLKIYLDASVETRARRRWQDYQAKGQDGSYEDILASMRQRDRIDSQREIAPLRPARDAIVIDTTNMDAGAVLEYVLKIVESRDCDRVASSREAEGDD